jgi:hypothetical protein
LIGIVVDDTPGSGVGFTAVEVEVEVGMVDFGIAATIAGPSGAAVAAPVAGTAAVVVDAIAAPPFPAIIVGGI